MSGLELLVVAGALFLIFLLVVIFIGRSVSFKLSKGNGSLEVAIGANDSSSNSEEMETPNSPEEKPPIS